MGLTREQRRQQWFDRAGEAHNQLGRVKSIVALYLTEPMCETDEAAIAIHNVYTDLIRAESHLRDAYRAEATVQPPEEEVD